MSLSAVVLEDRKPSRNRGPGDSFASRSVFAARRFLDLQMASVVRDVSPWLRARVGTFLEVGCGDQPYRVYLDSGVSYTGLDWKHANSDFAITPLPDVVYYDGASFPFADSSFASVFHTEVLEHVVDVPQFLSECFRVLQPGGSMMLTVPFQARFHYIPNDYWRFTPSGLKHVLARAGFADIRVLPRGSDLVVAAYKVVSVAYRLGYGGLVGRLLALAFAAPVVLLLAFAHVCVIFRFGSSDDCLGYTVLATRATSPLHDIEAQQRSEWNDAIM